MAISPVTICSNALLMLGDSPIASFDAPSDRARLAANLWPLVRDHVLRSHPWNCAIKRVALSPEVAPPPFDFAYSFLLPGDCLRVLSVGLEGDPPEYRLENRRILMDSNICQLRYIYRAELTENWDSSLVWAMTMVMRAVFSYGVTQSTSLEAQIEATLRPLLRQARAVDGQEDDQPALDSSPLVAARYSGGGTQFGMRGG